MPIFRQSIEISASPAEVYDYVSRPSRWREWQHGAVKVHELGVQEISKDSLVAGRRFESDISSSGRHYHLVWLVEEAQQARYWRASAYMADGSTLRLSYELEPSAHGTKFTRTMDYVLRPVFSRWIDKLFLQKKREKEIEQALKNLQDYFSR